MSGWEIGVSAAASVLNCRVGERVERRYILLVEVIADFLIGMMGGEVQKVTVSLFGRRLPHYKRGSFGD